MSQTPLHKQSELFTPVDLNNEPTVVKLKSNVKQQKNKKEERHLKCKSNDCQINQTINKQATESFIYEKNPNQSNLTDAKLNQKLKNRLMNKSHQVLETASKPEASVNANRLSHQPFYNHKLNVDYEMDLNKVLDSDEFVDLDESSNEKLNQIDRNCSKIESDETYDAESLRQSLSTDCIINSTVICKDVINESCYKISQKENKMSKSMYEKILSIDNHQETSCTSSSISFSNSAKSSASSASSSSSSNCVHDSSPLTSQTNLDKELHRKSCTESSALLSSSSTPYNIMSQSVTICEDSEHLFNETSDFDSSKQQLSCMSKSMHCASTSNSGTMSRSSRILNSIIKLSTNAAVSTSSYLSSTPITATPVNSTKNPLFKASLSSSKIQKPQNDTSKSLYCISDSKNENFNKNDYFEIIDENSQNNQIILNSINVNDWTPDMCKNWLENLGIFLPQIKNAMKYIKNGKTLFGMSDSELEKAFLINNSLHKRKLRYAIDDLKSPEKWSVLKMFFF